MERNYSVNWRGQDTKLYIYIYKYLSCRLNYCEIDINIEQSIIKNFSCTTYLNFLYVFISNNELIIWYLS